MQQSSGFDCYIPLTNWSISNDFFYNFCVSYSFANNFWKFINYIKNWYFSIYICNSFRSGHGRDHFIKQTWSISNNKTSITHTNPQANGLEGGWIQIKTNCSANYRLSKCITPWQSILIKSSHSFLEYILNALQKSWLWTTNRVISGVHFQGHAIALPKWVSSTFQAIPEILLITKLMPFPRNSNPQIIWLINGQQNKWKDSTKEFDAAE